MGLLLTTTQRLVKPLERLNCLRASETCSSPMFSASIEAMRTPDFEFICEWMRDETGILFRDEDRGFVESVSTTLRLNEVCSPSMTDG